ncbi:MAG: helix-turn-helix domain-containing protein [Clostridia bacterium]|nr:helix-turn-helix domain-containing protein [Clostridia bacterium]
MLGRKIHDLRKARGLTLLEVAEAVGTSKQTVSRYEKGIITNIPKEKIELLARALSVTPAELMGWESDALYERYDNISPVGSRRIPILGEVACGKPIFASEEHESYMCVGDDIPADFCLRAKGDSMIGARIYDSDIVFIEKVDMVKNGEIAVVIVGDEATLKRVYYYPEKEKLILSPENPKYEPLVFMGSELEDIQILGRAVAFQSVIR